MKRSERKHAKALERKDKELEKANKEFSKTLGCKNKEISLLKKKLQRKNKEISLLKKKLQRKNDKIATLESKKATHITNNINNNLIQINLDANCFQDRVEDYMNAVHGAIQFAVSALNDSDGDGKLYICSDLEKNLWEFFHSDNVGQHLSSENSVGPWK